MWKCISGDGMRKANITTTVNLHKSWLGMMFDGAQWDQNQTKKKTGLTTLKIEVSYETSILQRLVSMFT